MNLRKRKSDRGLTAFEFEDKYGYQCSIQDSSLATESAIWFGVDDPKPVISKQGEGFVPYNIPKEVLIHSRMHLTQAQVKELLPILIYFAKTGDSLFNYKKKISKGHSINGRSRKSNKSSRT